MRATSRSWQQNAMSAFGFLIWRRSTNTRGRHTKLIFGGWVKDTSHDYSHSWSVRNAKKIDLITNTSKLTVPWSGKPEGWWGRTKLRSPGCLASSKAIDWQKGWDKIGFSPRNLQSWLYVCPCNDCDLVVTQCIKQPYVVAVIICNSFYLINL